MVNPRAMPFKLNFSPTKAFRLPGHAVIHVIGPDSQAFLQAQCMNDVNALKNGEWQYNGWLSPLGRVFALFYVIRIEDGHFLLILPALSPQLLIDGLKRFVFRSKVRFEIEMSRHLSGSIGKRRTPEDPIVSGLDDGFLLQIGQGETSRQLHMGSQVGISDSGAAQRWHEMDMAAGWVWIDESLQDLWTPHMLSLQQINAFSLNKGCYPGQEIVARTHYLGKSKRGLFVVTGENLQPGASISQENREVGRVANCSYDGKVGVAVLNAGIPTGSTLDCSVMVGDAISAA